MFGSMAVLGLAFSSCSKEIAFDYEGIVNQQKAEYEANFIKKYGNVSPNQNWDFSTMQAVTSLPSSEGYANTRAARASITRSENQMLIDNKILSWTHENLKPGVNNTKKGQPFRLVVPDNSFTVVPIFQGCASYYWQLWMHVDGVANDQLVWSKGQDITYIKQAGSTEWLSPGTGQDGTKDAYEVKAPTFTFSGLPVGRSMYFYILVWTGGVSSYNGGANYNKKLTSMDKMMLALEVPEENRPVNVPEGNTVSIIGCEDNISTGSDNDFEDLVFLMYGNPTPPFVPVDEVVVKETKRYLIEDLGSRDDFDFNDVVVDMSVVWKEKVLYRETTNGGWEEYGREEIADSRHQEAIVRAMGGTINFKLKIGESVIWEKKGNYTVTDMLNTGWNSTTINPDAVYVKIENKDADGNVLWTWDPEHNNISVIVYENNVSAESEGTKTISFPKTGAIPMIIATDATILTPWMSERQSIPNFWYTEE